VSTTTEALKRRRRRRRLFEYAPTVPYRWRVEALSDEEIRFFAELAGVSRGTLDAHRLFQELGLELACLVLTSASTPRTAAQQCLGLCAGRGSLRNGRHRVPRSSLRLCVTSLRRRGASIARSRTSCKVGPDSDETAKGLF
jgi:hypothetical protein